MQDITDISHLPDLIRIVDEVLRTNRPMTLVQDELAVAVISPAKSHRRKPKTGRLSKNDPYLSLIGASESEEVTDVATRKHDYLAGAFDHS